MNITQNSNITTFILLPVSMNRVTDLFVISKHIIEPDSCFICQKEASHRRVQLQRDGKPSETEFCKRLGP